MAFYISRIKKRKEITFDVEVITPMFLGSADQKKAELRASSIKGLMRFWWRAINGTRNIAAMKSTESQIFGSTDQKSSFAIKIDPTGAQPTKSNLPSGTRFRVRTRRGTFSIGIIDYLAFGLRGHRRGYTREHIRSGNKFSILLSIYNTRFEKDILQAFEALVNFGGIGAKSRNGFGSVAVSDLGRPDLKFRGPVQRFTAISEKTKLFNNFKVHDRWEDALSEIGLAYRTARLCLSVRKRLLIAKPIVQLSGEDDRHAKPYFLKVNKRGDGKYQGQILFVPYIYNDPSKLKEYEEACDIMNRKITELMG